MLMVRKVGARRLLDMRYMRVGVFSADEPVEVSTELIQDAQSMIMSRRLTWLIIVTNCVSISPPCTACPFCDSATAAYVRSEIFGESFASHLAISCIPFLICIGILVLVRYWPISPPANRS